MYVVVIIIILQTDRSCIIIVIALHNKRACITPYQLFFFWLSIIDCNEVISPILAGYFHDTVHYMYNKKTIIIIIINFYCVKN